MVHNIPGTPKVWLAALTLGIILSACGGSDDDSSDTASSSAASSTATSSTSTSSTSSTASSSATSEASSSSDSSSSSEASSETSSEASSSATYTLSTCGQSAVANSSHTVVDSTCWYEDFTATDSSTFESTDYATQTDTTALYTVLGGGSNLSFSDGVLTFGGSSGNRFAVGSSLGTTTTTTSDTSMSGLGMFDFSGKSCTLLVYTTAEQTAGKFQVMVDNNTTSSANSPLGSSSRVFNGLLTAGLNTITFSGLTTSSTDFLHIRADSTASATGSIQIDWMDLSCE